MAKNKSTLLLVALIIIVVVYGFINQQADQSKKATEMYSCISEGNMGSASEKQVCCGSLAKIDTSAPGGNPTSCSTIFKGAFLCANCGNGSCGTGENSCNCPKDCK